MRMSIRHACVSLIAFAVVAGIGATDEVPDDHKPKLGVYRWANGTANVDAFADWLGRPSVWGLDFIGGESWDNVEWPTWWLETWSKWVHAKSGRRLVLAVPLLAGPPDRSGPTQGTKDVGLPVSIEKGAAGEYNHHFKQLAENLVAYELTEAILRPGWEFNGGWYAWGAKSRAKEFAAYWRQVVTTMRSVAGTEKLTFCWNPTLGEQDFLADEAWPGDQFVDWVGVDVYDETWLNDTYPWPVDATAEEIAARYRKVWDEWIIASPRGLAFWSEFAKAHGKPLAIPEWGVNLRQDGHAGGDNPYFIEQMHAFINNPSNNVAFHCYFDVNVDGYDHRHQLSPGVNEHGKPDATEFMKSSAKFKVLFKSNP